MKNILLLAFLIEHGILLQYEKNRLKKEPDLYSTNPFEETPETQSFSSGFIWTETPEGQKYWHSYDEKWLELFDDDGNLI